MKEERVAVGAPPDADNSRQQQQWHLNLLDHIDSVQDDVAHRMDFVEKELDGEENLTINLDLWPENLRRCAF